jgi:hypothetical protein
MQNVLSKQTSLKASNINHEMTDFAEDLQQRQK